MCDRHPSDHHDHHFIRKCVTELVSLLIQNELKKTRVFWTSHLKRFITGGLTFQQNRTAGAFLGQKGLERTKV